jgi:hypothetical protein
MPQDSPKTYFLKYPEKHNTKGMRIVVSSSIDQYRFEHGVEKEPEDEPFDGYHPQEFRKLAGRLQELHPALESDPDQGDWLLIIITEMHGVIEDMVRSNDSMRSQP